MVQQVAGLVAEEILIVHDGHPWIGESPLKIATATCQTGITGDSTRSAQHLTGAVDHDSGL